MAVRSYTFQRANTDVAQLESELIAAGIPIVRVSVDGQTCRVEVDVCQETHQDFLNLRWARMREKVVAHTPGVPAVTNGAPGPPGPQGPIGLAGSPGANGSPGPQGPIGVTGPKGDKGDLGDAGPQGLPGASGAAGSVGQAGAQGPTGLQGSTGPQGLKGDKGDIGNTGAQGPIGLTGLIGLTGPQGPTGNTGLTGAQGSQGPAGSAGPTGPQGQTGSTGSQGPPGTNGTNGTNGVDGATWRNASGAPSNGLGVNGDYYLDTATGDIHKKAAGTYSLIGNIKGATGAQGAQGNAGSQGIQGIQGNAGAQGNTGAQGATGPVTGKPLVFHPVFLAASAIATNLALNTFSAVSDPNYRQMVDLRGMTKVRIQGRIGGSLVAATKLRFQYNLSADPNVATGDAGWLTFADTAGSHVLNTMFYSAEISIPVGAQVNNVQLRVGLFSGDGVADPTITCAVLNVYV